MKAINVFKQFEIYPEECLELLRVFNLIHASLFKHESHTLFLPMEERDSVLSVSFR